LQELKSLVAFSARNSGIEHQKRKLLWALGIAIQVKRWELIVIKRRRAADVCEVLRASDPPEVHIGIVGLPIALHPTEPIVAPLASCSQRLGEPGAALLARASPVVVVAIEVATGVPRKLRGTSVGEGALSCPRDLQVKAVLSGDVIANVCDLHDHRFAHDVTVRAAPQAMIMGPIHKPQLKALATICIAGETMISRYCRSSKPHAQVPLVEEWCMVRARRRSAALADRSHVWVKKHLTCPGITRPHRLVGVALPWPCAAGLAAIPIACGPSATCPPTHGLHI